MDNNSKKIKEAAALKYSPGEDAAPRIIALGKGVVAEKIVETAKKNSIPIYEDAELAHALNYLSVGDEIPQELYGIVAEILVYIGYLDKSYGEKNSSQGSK